jgi:hypothetical protein
MLFNLDQALSFQPFDHNAFRQDRGEVRTDAYRHLGQPEWCNLVIAGRLAATPTPRSNGVVWAWGRASDEFNHLLKLGDAELGRDFVDASLMQQQNSRDDVFGHALSSGPAHIG